MDIALLLERIPRQIIIKEDLPASEYGIFQRASKYAFYNPAEKDKDGNVVIHAQKSHLIFFAIIAIFVSILAIREGTYKVLILTLPVLILSVIYYFFRPNRNLIIVNEKGVTIKKKEYAWKDYIGIYYFDAPSGRGKGHCYVYLIFIRPDGSYFYLNDGGISNQHKIGTAIRDFAPSDYI